MLAFIESGVFIYVLAAIAGVGIITKLISAARYSRLERQAEDVAGTRDTYIRLWKNKFENAYRVNKGMNDPDLFVERCMNQCKLMGIHLFKWDRLNRVLCSVCLMLSAAVVTIEVRAGFETGQVLGHFLTCLSICSLMVFIEVFCETGEKRQRIGLNLTDYFVNTLSGRLAAGVEMVTAEADSVSRLDLREQMAGAKSDSKAPFHRESVRSEDVHNNERRDSMRGEDMRREERRDSMRREDVRSEERRDSMHREDVRSEEGHDGMRREAARSERRDDISREELRRGEARQDRTRERDMDSLKESLDRIAASREPEDDDRRDKRSRSKREEDVRLIEEILREYLK